MDLDWVIIFIGHNTSLHGYDGIYLAILLLIGLNGSYFLFFSFSVMTILAFQFLWP